MYAQQSHQSSPGYAAAGQSPIASIVQDTVLRLKDLDVRLEVVNQELAQLCDTIGAPQVAQLARTPREAFAANLIGAQSPHGLSQTGAPFTPGAMSPQGAWGQASPFGAAQSTTWASANPFAVNQAAVNPFMTAPMTAPTSSPHAISPFVASPFAANNPFVASPFTANNPYAANNPFVASPFAANNPFVANPYAASPFAATPYAASPYVANPYAASAFAARDYASQVSPYANSWNVPQNVQSPIAAGFAGAPSSPFASGVIR